MTRVIGIDIGGTKIAGAVMTMAADTFEIVEVRHVSTPAGPENVMQAVIALCVTLYDSDTSVAAIGIGAAGQIDTAQGVVSHAVETIPGWAGMAIRERVQAVVPLLVRVDNDVNAMALAETNYGAGRAYRHSLLLTVGTGVGGALVMDGRLWYGAHWNGGELGHVLVDWRSDRRCTCGARGHLEAYAAGPAIAADYCERIGTKQRLDLRYVSQQAAAGDPQAQAAICQGAQILGAAVAGLANAFDPEAVIIGGGVPNLGARWWSPLRETFAASVFPHLRDLPLLSAELGEQATLIGAARLAYDRMKT